MKAQNAIWESNWNRTYVSMVQIWCSSIHLFFSKASMDDSDGCRESCVQSLFGFTVETDVEVDESSAWAGFLRRAACKWRFNSRGWFSGRSDSLIVLLQFLLRIGCAERLEGWFGHFFFLCCRWIQLDPHRRIACFCLSVNLVCVSTQNRGGWVGRVDGG